jgi:hypothetical protein
MIVADGGFVESVRSAATGAPPRWIQAVPYEHRRTSVPQAEGRWRVCAQPYEATEEPAH